MANEIPTVEVSIKHDSLRLNAIKIIVRNSNPYNIPLTKETLESIFKIGRHYSSKRNIFRITKGALGDAMKEILCIPHALGEDLQIEDEWRSVPLTIRNAGKEFDVYLVTDRLKEKIDSEIKEKEYDIPDVTEIEVTLPVSSMDSEDEGKGRVGKEALLSRLYEYVVGYALFTTHITFILHYGEGHIKRLYATQSINSKWKNLSSIHWYTLQEFKKLLFGLSKESGGYKTYHVLYNIIREVSNLKKGSAPESELTLEEIVQSKEDVRSLYNKLKESMPNSPTTISLPFDIRKRARMKALKERLEQYARLSIDDSKVKYKQALGLYKEGSTSIPFFYEIMILHDMRVCLKTTLAIEQALNCSSVPTQSIVFQGDDEFAWSTLSGNTEWMSRSIEAILHHYGYSINAKDCKKPYSIILVNLVSPKLTYKSYGKSRINFAPFANVVAETTIKACMGGGRTLDGKPSKKSVLLEILTERKDKWESMSLERQRKDLWTQSDVFYATRKRAIEKYSYKNEEIDRNYITSIIRSTCEEDLNVKREDIGIIAADRAQLYFKGKWMDVGLQEMNELVQYGTDMLIIEKEGVVEQLKLFADEYGIALLNTRGFLTEYAEILQNKAEKEGCNISILTDFDASGLAIACNVSNAYRIGIDFETLNDLDIEISDVEEGYDSPKKHLSKLQHAGYYYRRYSKDVIEYVEQKRVEINSVMVRLDDHAKFWNWIIDKLRDHFPTRDYTRSVNIPDYVIPQVLQDFNDKVKKVGTEAVAKQLVRLRNNLSNINGGFLFDRTNDILQEHEDGEQTTIAIIGIPEYDRILKDHIRHVIESNESVKELIDKIADAEVTNSKDE